MPEIKTEFLFKITLEVPPLLDLGETCYGRRRLAPAAPRRRAAARCQADHANARPAAHLHDLPGLQAWPAGSDRPAQSRRGRRSEPVLFPRHAVFRDGRQELRVDEQDLLGRDRLPHGKRTDLPRVPGAVMLTR